MSEYISFRGFYYFYGGIDLKKYAVISLRSLTAAAVLLALSASAVFGAAKFVSLKANARLRRIPIYCVETENKAVAVTFDAAWDADDTDRILEILEKHKAKATFFAVGDWLKKYPDRAKKISEAGHEIGNHSDTHPAFSKLGREEITKELNKCNEKIKAITGKDCTLARAPSGDYDNKSIECAEALGLTMIQWSVDSLDWKNLSTAEITQRVLNQCENGSILLFHTGVENTPKALDVILGKLRSDGYQCVTVGELIYKDDYTIDRAGKQCPNCE